MALASGSSPLVLAPNLLFVLGNVAFNNLEAPEELAISVSQSLAIKDFIGGKRSIQALGTVWKPLKWGGIFTGSDAEYRARILQRMTAQATIQRLTYLSYAFDVVIRDFTSTWKYQWECPYDITVEILNDASGVVAYTAPKSVDSQIHAAVRNANDELNKVQNETQGYVDPTDADLAAAHGAAVKALDAAGPAAQATGDLATKALTSIQKVITKAQSYISILPPNKLSTKLISLTKFTNNWIVVQKNFNRGQSPKTISLNGASLFDIASQFYNDPSLATALQIANGLSSTQLPSGILTSIILPPLQSLR
jgi:hypothetical protein